MLKNLTTKTKLMLIPIVYVVIVAIVTIVFKYYDNMVDNRIEAASKTDIFVQQVLKGRITVYQFLRKPNNENAQKVKESFALLDKNVKQLQEILEDDDSINISNNILKESENYINYFEKFSNLRIKDYNQGIEKETDELKVVLQKMVDTGLELEKHLNHINKVTKKLRAQAESSMDIAIISIIFVSIFIFVGFSIALSSIVARAINNFKDGLSSFFAYINKESDDTKLLLVDGKDEFAQMAIEVNESIEKTKSGLIKDNETVKEVLAIVEKANLGYLDQTVKNKPSNPQLVLLCDALNSMLKGIKGRVDSINAVLNKFSNYNFTDKLDDKGIEGDIEKLVTSVNFLTDEISGLLKKSYTIGLTLDASSDQLLINVDTLNKSSTEAAASLEETAAALEEITSTIVNNGQNVQTMSDYSNKLTHSAKTGQTLAQNTTDAMEEITDQVNSISEAISVIDQIAFQTNILSLNAAVEAATAGEAGKGFAVVAQEVRNLASRSAEAAKEIKELVENATNKASHGKQISNQMISGYDELLSDINKSAEMITEITNASKEQEQGITQINDAINQLDQQTQQNAAIASETHDIAVETDTIAKEIVDDASSKEFLGKSDVKVKEYSPKKEEKITKKQETKVEQKKQEKEIKPKKEETFKAQSNDDEEWESF